MVYVLSTHIRGADQAGEEWTVESAVWPKAPGQTHPPVWLCATFVWENVACSGKKDGRTTIVDEARESAFLIDFVLGFF